MCGGREFCDWKMYQWFHDYSYMVWLVARQIGLVYKAGTRSMRPMSLHQALSLRRVVWSVERCSCAAGKGPSLEVKLYNWKEEVLWDTERRLNICGSLGLPLPPVFFCAPVSWRWLGGGPSPSSGHACTLTCALERSRTLPVTWSCIGPLSLLHWLYGFWVQSSKNTEPCNISLCSCLGKGISSFHIQSVWIGKVESTDRVQ